jgi:hypothetical protein
MRAGQIGTIRTVELPGGRVQANARMRDETGSLRRLKTVGDTEQDAVRALHEQADAIRYGSVGRRLTAHSTLAEACAVFLDDKRRSQTVEASTIEAYESSIAHVVIPECGELLLSDMTVLRINRILQGIREGTSLSAAQGAQRAVAGLPDRDRARHPRLQSRPRRAASAAAAEEGVRADPAAAGGHPRADPVVADGAKEWAAPERERAGERDVDHGRHQRPHRRGAGTAPMRCGCHREPADDPDRRDDHADHGRGSAP